jgi:hypothetical protein
MSTMKRLLGLAASAALWIACAGTGAGGAGACAPGQTQPCVCASGISATQTCDATSAWEACSCGPDGGVLGSDSDAASVCGDGKCSADENCRTCTVDCGKCAKCEFSPSCDGALGAPVAPVLRGDLCDPVATGDGGAAPAPIVGTSCLDPELRIRISKIRSRDGDGDVYCIVDAADGSSSEAAITSKMPLTGGKEVFFSQGEGTLWGQKALKPTTNNLTLTYSCYKVADNGGAWAAALSALGSTATAVGGSSLNPYGWAFDLGGAGANAAAAAVQAANSKDELRINWQQTISKDQLLDLTNGRTWTVRRTDSGGLFGTGSWDWEITIQSWGCAETLSRAR